MLVTDLYCFGIANAMTRLTSREIAATRASKCRWLQSNSVRWAQRGQGTGWSLSSRSKVAKEGLGVIRRSSHSASVLGPDSGRENAPQFVDQESRRIGE